MKGRFPIPETVLSFRFEPEKPARSYFVVHFRPFCRANVSAYEPGLPTIVRRQHPSKASCPIFVTDAGRKHIVRLGPREVGIGPGSDFRQLTGGILDKYPLLNTIMEYIAGFMF